MIIILVLAPFFYFAGAFRFVFADDVSVCVRVVLCKSGRKGSGEGVGAVPGRYNRAMVIL